MLTKPEVIELYHCILGREPESEGVVARAIDVFESFQEFRNVLLQSDEFQRAHVPPVRYLFDAMPHPLSEEYEPNICLAVIVKNEENRIGQMLESVSRLVSHYAIVDTGSTDHTVSVIRRTLDRLKKGSSIYGEKFSNFAHARNLSLSLVPESCEWILVLDADEHIVPADLARIVQLTQCEKETDGWHLPRYNFVDADKALPPKSYPDFQRRLFRNIVANPIRYDGLVHEQPVSEGVWKFASVHNFGPNGWIGGPHIHHMGFVDVDHSRWLIKHTLYERLLKESSSA